ncbi:hypothetical protein HHK36_003092 [Tetracentron sinense]|uniref:BFN domain-containing protein n=1 Tax=Tetracentron sinense TaxID=13715 RepID=A0A834ZNP5_TETSI|nr:hypothetical protein HHK36_003092 [Tetracentron sinense]
MEIITHLFLLCMYLEGGEMGVLQGPVISSPVRAKQEGVYTLSVNGPFLKAKILRSRFWGFKGTCKVGPLIHQPQSGKCRTVHCSFSSSPNDNGSTAENFNENDQEYVNSSVVEAEVTYLGSMSINFSFISSKPGLNCVFGFLHIVEVKSGADGSMIRMSDGTQLRCVHNNPQGGHLPDYAPHPAIVLKMEDGSDLLLPIIVLEIPSLLLMAAVRNAQIISNLVIVPQAKPTVYQIMKKMIENMGYAVKLVRVTKRVHEAYFAHLYLTKAGNKTESVSFDLRPSDAINMAVICKCFCHLRILMDRCHLPLSLPSRFGDRNPGPKAKTPEAPSAPSSNASWGKRRPKFQLGNRPLTMGDFGLRDSRVARVLMDGVRLPEDTQAARSWGDLRGEVELEVERWTVAEMICEVGVLREQEGKHEAIVERLHKFLASYYRGVLNDMVELDRVQTRHLVMEELRDGSMTMSQANAVPIQVNKYLAYNEGMRVVEPAKMATEAPLSDGLLLTELDQPDGQPCDETEEFDLVHNMLIAAVEERYRDAGLLSFLPI